MNVRLRWVNSTPGLNQLPLASTSVEARVSTALPWTEINRVPVPAAELLIENVEPGDWIYRAMEIDTAGMMSARSNEVTVNVAGPVVNVPPTGVGTSLTATVEP